MAKTESLLSKQDQLEKLRRLVEKKDLPLKKTAKNLVFGKGNSEAPIVFIGEAPGAQEDLKGIPFVGTAGKTLDKLLQSIGLSLEQVYIANILKYRPPNNRAPNMKEIMSHTPFLIEQLKIIQPKVIVTLGNFATKFILAKCDAKKMDTISGISNLHGQAKKIRFDNYTFTVIPLYHPAAVLYNRTLQSVLEEDFQIIKDLI